MLSEYEMVLRLVIAAFLGGLIGFERERLSWAAGLRTHMLVCLGASLIMLVSQYAFHEVVHVGLVNLDPSRVAAQVVSGIGFLGAGTILFQKNVIRGLTTAASLWAVAAVGLAVGGGLYLEAFCTTFLILIILAGLKPIERKFMRKNQLISVRFSGSSNILSMASFQQIVNELNLQYGPTRLQIEKLGEKETFYLIFKGVSTSNFLNLIDQLRHIEGVENIELINEMSAVS